MYAPYAHTRFNASPTKNPHDTDVLTPESDGFNTNPMSVNRRARPATAMCNIPRCTGTLSSEPMTLVTTISAIATSARNHESINVPWNPLSPPPGTVTPRAVQQLYQTGRNVQMANPIVPPRMILSAVETLDRSNP